MKRVHTSEQKAIAAQRMRERRAAMTPEERDAHLAHRRATRKPTDLSSAQKARAQESGRQWRARNPQKARWQSRVTQHNIRGLGRIRRLDWESVLVVFDQRCAYCGVHDDLVVEHVVPLGDGGRNEVENIVPACASCNHVKGKRGPLVMANRAYSPRDAWNRRVA